MKQLHLVHGKPGSGKTTVSALAAAQLGNAYHFSIGDELRDRALHGKPSRHSAELQQYAEALKQSLPVPPHLAALVFEECIETSPYDLIIVDGYPQYPDRLPAFEATNHKIGGEVIDICVIEVTDEVARQRLTNRLSRSDVTEDETYITKRLEGFSKNVNPTIAALSNTYPVHSLDGSGTPDEVAAQLVGIIRHA